MNSEHGDFDLGSEGEEIQEIQKELEYNNVEENRRIEDYHRLINNLQGRSGENYLSKKHWEQLKNKVEQAIRHNEEKVKEHTEEAKKLKEDLERKQEDFTKRIEKTEETLNAIQAVREGLNYGSDLVIQELIEEENTQREALGKTKETLEQIKEIIKTASEIIKIGVDAIKSVVEAGISIVKGVVGVVNDVKKAFSFW